MKPIRSICILLVCCSVFRVVSSSMLKARPPPAPVGCDSTLAFPLKEASSLSEGNGNIHTRSLSPWTWRSTTVKDRIPATLWEAECSKSHCVSPNPGFRDQDNLNSVPIYQNVLVLTRGEGHCYTASYRLVAVGCTCVWANTKQN